MIRWRSTLARMAWCTEMMYATYASHSSAPRRIIATLPTDASSTRAAVAYRPSISRVWSLVSRSGEWLFVVSHRPQFYK